MRDHTLKKLIFNIFGNKLRYNRGQGLEPYSGDIQIKKEYFHRLVEDGYCKADDLEYFEAHPEAFIIIYLAFTFGLEVWFNKDIHEIELLQGVVVLTLVPYGKKQVNRFQIHYPYNDEVRDVFRDHKSFKEVATVVWDLAKDHVIKNYVKQREEIL